LHHYYEHALAWHYINKPVIGPLEEYPKLKLGKHGLEYKGKVFYTWPSEILYCYFKLNYAARVRGRGKKRKLYLFEFHYRIINESLNAHTGSVRYSLVIPKKETNDRNN
jgi:hypothetical protein